MKHRYNGSFNVTMLLGSLEAMLPAEKRQSDRIIIRSNVSPSSPLATSIEVDDRDDALTVAQIDSAVAAHVPTVPKSAGEDIAEIKTRLAALESKDAQPAGK